jgi:hypothetical protein
MRNGWTKTKHGQNQETYRHAKGDCGRITAPSERGVDLELQRSSHAHTFGKGATCELMNLIVKQAGDFASCT